MGDGLVPQRPRGRSRGLEEGRGACRRARRWDLSGTVGVVEWRRVRGRGEGSWEVSLEGPGSLGGVGAPDPGAVLANLTRSCRWQEPPRLLLFPFLSAPVTFCAKTTNVVLENFATFFMSSSHILDSQILILSKNTTVPTLDHAV